MTRKIIFVLIMFTLTILPCFALIVTAENIPQAPAPLFEPAKNIPQAPPEIDYNSLKNAQTMSILIPLVFFLIFLTIDLLILFLIKNKKTWLKGGLWGLNIGLVGILCLLLGNIWDWIGLLVYINSLSFFTFILVGSLFFHTDEFGFSAMLFGIYLAPLTYFILGSIVGYIVGKIKSRREVGQ